MARSLILAVLALLPMLAWGEGYICVEDLSTGFTYDKRTQQWRTSNFMPGKFVISRMKVGELEPLPWHAWKVVQVGERFPESFCDEPSANSNGALICEGDSSFRLNPRALRFIRAFPQGYWDIGYAFPGGSEGDSTPSLSIGKCSPM